MLEKFALQLAVGDQLTDEQVREAVEQLADDKIQAAIKADFLSALAKKGETADEIAAFVRALREKSISPPIDSAWRNSHEILDVVGTGGDRLGTFNISTGAALICAAAGVVVAKHGNRAVTSQAGSADALEALGIRIDLTPADAVRSLQGHGFAFFFAPAWHPAFKHISPARKLCAERGQRTIFNYLGPLLNPVRPSAMLIGVPRPELCEPMARVLQSLGVRRAMVVCGAVQDPDTTVHGCIDELSTLGENTIAEFYQERGFATSTLLTEQFPLQEAVLADLLGSDRHANAEIIRRIFRGAESDPGKLCGFWHRDAYP